MSDLKLIDEVYEAIDNIAPSDKKSLIVPMKGINKEDLFTDNIKAIFIGLASEQVDIYLSNSDISTVKGREEIKSNGRKIAKIRNRIEDLKKSVTEEWRLKTNEVNAQARDIKSQLEALEKKVLKPLTDFENAEKARISEHEKSITAIEFFRTQTISNIEIAENYLKELEECKKRDWQEFSQRAEIAYNESKNYLVQQIERLKEIKRQEEELAELERKAEEARQKEREEKIRREAEEKARKEAEAKAEAERQAILKAEQEKRDAELRKQREEQERIEAERKKAQEEKEELERKIAAQQAEADRIERERLAREADLEHRKKINNSIVDYFMKHGIKKEQAISIVIDIVNGDIPNIKIEY